MGLNNCKQNPSLRYPIDYKSFGNFSVWFEPRLALTFVTKSFIAFWSKVHLSKSENFFNINKKINQAVETKGEQILTTWSFQEGKGDILIIINKKC